MGKKKPNPTKIHRTQADVNRAEDRATRRAVGAAFRMMCYILLDKHNAPPEEVQQFVHELEWLASSIYSNEPGHLTWGDVDRVLDEYDIKLRFF